MDTTALMAAFVAPLSGTYHAFHVSTFEAAEELAKRNWLARRTGSLAEPVGASDEDMAKRKWLSGVR